MRRPPLLALLLGVAVAAAAEQIAPEAAKRRNTLGGLGLALMAAMFLRR